MSPQAPPPQLTDPASPGRSGGRRAVIVAWLVAVVLLGVTVGLGAALWVTTDRLAGWQQVADERGDELDVRAERIASLEEQVDELRGARDRLEADLADVAAERAAVGDELRETEEALVLSASAVLELDDLGVSMANCVDDLDAWWNNPPTAGYDAAVRAWIAEVEAILSVCRGAVAAFDRVRAELGF